MLPAPPPVWISSAAGCVPSDSDTPAGPLSPLMFCGAGTFRVAATKRNRHPLLTYPAEDWS